MLTEDNRRTQSNEELSLDLEILRSVDQATRYNRISPSTRYEILNALFPEIESRTKKDRFTLYKND